MTDAPTRVILDTGDVQTPWVAARSFQLFWKIIDTDAFGHLGLAAIRMAMIVVRGGGCVTAESQQSTQPR